MTRIDAVIGLNYGDEGKGHVVDKLIARSHLDSAVLRFNGGGQAAHTVVAGDKRHVFHHLGSGSFLGVPTILSRFFVVHPWIFADEYIHLNRKLRVYVDPDCYITTPYDIELNRIKSAMKGHGTTGTGFGETIQRNEDGVDLTVGQAQSKDKIDLYDIREYFFAQLEDMGIQGSKYWERMKAMESKFHADMEFFFRAVTVVPDWVAVKWFDYVVFEGAQGLRLDQYSEDFPQVTRSSTGLENVVEILDGSSPNNVFYVTRSYLTRHGAGPLENEIPNPGICDETNQFNKWQEQLRFASSLNFDRMAKDVSRDLKFLEKPTNITAVITCCDQYGDFFNQDGPLSEVLQKVVRATQADRMVTSYGPDRTEFIGI